MLVNSPGCQTVTALSFEQTLDEVVGALRSNDRSLARKKVDAFVSHFFDFEKPEKPQVAKLMKGISMMHRTEREMIETLFDSALAVHESLA